MKKQELIGLLNQTIVLAHVTILELQSTEALQLYKEGFNNKFQSLSG